MVTSVTMHCMQNILQNKTSDLVNGWQIVYSKNSEKFLDKLNNKDKRKILDKFLY